MPKLKGGVDGSLIPEPARHALQDMKTWNEDGIRRIVQHYLASISLIDDSVGILLTALAETGQVDNTIIVFVSDHGEFLGNHGLIRKPSLHYDETIRVPLIIRAPKGYGGGRRVRGLVEMVDVHPTLMGLSGLTINPGVQGIDWSGAIRDSAHIGRADIHADMYDDAARPETCFMPRGGPYMAVQTIRTEAWKLSIYPTATSAYGQLFDLVNDADESRNLYADPNYRDMREQLLWRLTQRMARNIDPLPLVLSQY